MDITANARANFNEGDNWRDFRMGFHVPGSSSVRRE